MTDGSESVKKTGGEGGIRTPDTGVSPYNGLANRRLQPLGHLSAYRLRGSRRCLDALYVIAIVEGERQRAQPQPTHGSRLTWNPKAFSKSGGTYLWSLFCNTHSRSSVELWYCSGDSLRESTTLSNELADEGDVLLRRGLVEFEFSLWGAIKNLRPHELDPAGYLLHSDSRSCFLSSAPKARFVCETGWRQTFYRLRFV
jgi:hypothetical protein